VYIACIVACVLHGLLRVYCMFCYVYIACFVMCILHVIFRVFCMCCYVHLRVNTRGECEEFCKFLLLLFHLVFFLRSRVSCGYSSHFLLLFLP